MVSTVSLWSAEFLDMVSGDLEVPPDEYFELEIMASRSDGESGERWPKWIEIVHKCSSFCTILL